MIYNQIRNYLKEVISVRKRILFISLALLITLSLIGCSQTTNNSVENYSKKVANIKVGEQKLDGNEFSNRLEIIKNFWDEVGIDITAKDQGEFYDKLLNGLKEKMIHEAQMKQYAKENGFYVDRSKIINKLEENEDNKGYKNDTFVLGQIEIEIIKDKIYESLITKAEVTDKEIEDFYKENPHFFETGELATAKMILNFSKEKSEEALKALQAGEKFEEVAKKHSEDQETAEHGGDFGTFEIGSMFPDSEEFQNKMRNAKIGEYTDIITVEMGSYNVYVIALVEEIIPNFTIPLEDAKEDIRYFLKEEKALQEFDKIMNEVMKIKVQE